MLPSAVATSTVVFDDQVGFSVSPIPTQRLVHFNRRVVTSRAIHDSDKEISDDMRG